MVSYSFCFTRAGLLNDDYSLLLDKGLVVHDAGADEFNSAATATLVSAIA
jgi:hypothetical protein